MSSRSLRPHRPLSPALLLLCATLIAASCGRADASSGARAGESAGTKTAVTPVATSTDTLPDSVLVQRVDAGRVKGPAQGMWVVMISDYQCPYCKQWHDSAMAALDRDYITPGRIRFAYLNLPLTSIHPHARAEAKAALCAGAQGRYWEYSAALFEAQPNVRTMSDVGPLVRRISRDLALDSAAFQHCLASRAVEGVLDNDIGQAQRAGVQSTPSFIIGPFMVQGALPWPDFRRAVDTALLVARNKGSR